MAECWGRAGMRVPLWIICMILLLAAVITMAAELDFTESPFLADPFAPMRKSVTKEAPTPRYPGRYGGKLYPPPAKDLTTRLPEFLPDGPRPFIPDPSFLPGDQNLVVHQGDVAVLPCTVQHLGTRQISWNKVGVDHFLSIGTEVWVQDANLEVVHYTWPAGVGEWNLVFREARLQDSGMYECQIISTEKLTLKVKLTVIDKPPHRPEIRIEGKSFVESGQSVYLRCNTTEGDRIPDDVDWFKDGDKIDAKEYPNVVITKFRSKDTMSLVSELVISGGTSNDSGTYICRSSSDLIASVEVNVLVADSSNVKRGTGVSHTQTGSGYNAGSPLLSPKFYMTGNLLLVCLAVLISLSINRLNT